MNADLNILEIFGGWNPGWLELSLVIYVAVFAIATFRWDWWSDPEESGSIEETSGSRIEASDDGVRDVGSASEVGNTIGVGEPASRLSLFEGF